MSGWNLPPGVTLAMVDGSMGLEECCQECPDTKACLDVEYCILEAQAEYNAWHALWQGETASGIIPSREDWEHPCACTQLNGECSRAKQCLHGC